VITAVAVSARSGAAAEADEPEVSYRVSREGLWWFGDLRSAVREQSMTMALSDHPPATLRQLEKRVEDDVEPMTPSSKHRATWRPPSRPRSGPIAPRFG
jgi:hypothetical protein